MSEKVETKPTTDAENVEVEELDDKQMEEASGGVGDVNNFQCYC